MKDLSETKITQKDKLLKVTFELKTVKKLYEALKEVHESQTIKLLEKDKLAEDLGLKANGAEEALENMRRDIDEMVEMEVADKETKFMGIEAELEHYKEKQKETSRELKETIKDRTRIKEVLAKEKKKLTDLKRDLEYLRTKYDYSEK